VTTAGGNLFSIAGQQYGDATAWTGIAKANNLTDPFVQGTQTLNIPAKPDTAGGILNA
jgi:nucleoid-associated protein YgaU